MKSFRYPALMFCQPPSLENYWEKTPLFCIFHSQVDHVLEWTSLATEADTMVLPPWAKNDTVSAIQRFYQEFNDLNSTSVILALGGMNYDIEFDHSRIPPNELFGVLAIEVKPSMPPPGFVVEGQRYLLQQYQKQPQNDVQVIALFS